MGGGKLMKLLRVREKRLLNVLPEDLSLIRVEKKVAKQLVTKYHYLGSKGFRYKIAYAIVYDNVPYGVAVFHNVSAPETVVGAFGLPRTQQEGIYELGRFVLHPFLNGRNIGSYFLSRSIKMLKKDLTIKALITYADSSLHDGGLYRATNFKYCGLTAPKKDYWINGKIQERGKTKGLGGEWKPRPQKHRYVLVFDKDLHLKWEIQIFKKRGDRDEERKETETNRPLKARTGTSKVQPKISNETSKVDKRRVLKKVRRTTN